MSGNEFLVLRKNDAVDGSSESTLTADSTGPQMVASVNSRVSETLNGLVESVFHFTLIPSPDKVYGIPVVYLPDVREMLETDTAGGSELEVLEHAIFERTLLPDPGAHLLKTKHGVSATHRAVQKDCVVYLFECFMELRSAQREGRFPTVGKDVYDKIFGFLCTNISTALKQPDLYSPQNVHQQVCFSYFNRRYTV